MKNIYFMLIVIEFSALSVLGQDGKKHFSVLYPTE